MDWKTLLAYITGSVDQHLLLRNEYLVTENRILRNQIKGRVRLSDGERQALAELGQKLGKQTLHEVAKIVKPDTILGWHRKLVAQKFDGSHQRKAPGRPTINEEIEALVVRMAQENRSWGYDRIVGALANLGYTVSDQTVGNILKRHGIAPAPKRKTTTTWKEFIRTHMDVLVQYLRQLRKAEGGLSGMNTTKAGDLVAHLGQSNRLRFFRKHLYRFLHVFGATTVGFQVQDALGWVARVAVSPEPVGHIDPKQRQVRRIRDPRGGDVHEVFQAPVLFSISKVKLNLAPQTMANGQMQCTTYLFRCARWSLYGRFFSAESA
jgi:transposase